LVVTHNQLGNCLVDCVRHVLGDVPHQLKVLPVHCADDPDCKLTEGFKLIEQIDKGRGVLVLSDIYGATPSNIARRLCEGKNVLGVAGVNLPMLLRVVCYPTRTLQELAQIAIEGGRESIVTINPEQ